MDLRKLLFRLPGFGGLALAGAGAAGGLAIATGRSPLVPTDSSPAPRARGEVTVDRFELDASRKERAWFRLAVSGLDPDTTYTLWADDPSVPGGAPVQFGWLTTGAAGDGRLRRDTKRGDALPLGASLASLAGDRLEVRDAAGEVTLLAGSIPAVG